MLGQLGRRSSFQAHIEEPPRSVTPKSVRSGSEGPTNWHRGNPPPPLGGSGATTTQGGSGATTSWSQRNPGNQRNRKEVGASRSDHLDGTLEELNWNHRA